MIPFFSQRRYILLAMATLGVAFLLLVGCNLERGLGDRNIVAIMGAPGTSTPTVTATATPTQPTPSPTATASATATPAMAYGVVVYAQSTPTATATATPSPTATPTNTPTATPTATPEPMPTSDGMPRSLRVPILMYHYIEEAPPRADAIRRDLSVPPRRFAEQLAYLREAGYTSITLHDLALALQIGQPLPEKPIILTFDDGYANHYENALPLLREYGFVGTFFVITDCADRGDPNYVSWEQIVTMDREGMEIGSHAYTHVSLHGRDVDYLVWQMLGSREAVEERLHKPVRFFCYPSGDYDELAQHVLHTAHYWGAVTTEPGMEHHSDAMFELRRIRVHGHYGAKELAAAIATFDEK